MINLFTCASCKIAIVADSEWIIGDTFSTASQVAELATEITWV